MARAMKAVRMPGGRAARTLLNPLILLAVLILGVGFDKTAGTGSENATAATVDSVGERECFSASCNRTAASLANFMNVSANPCEDFFAFACGNYVRDTAIPADKKSIGVVDQMETALRLQLREMLGEPPRPGEPRPFEMAKMLYRSCEDTTRLEEIGLEPARKLLAELGGWPVLEGIRWSEEKFDWKTTTYKLAEMGMYGDYLFTFGLFVDISNTSRYTIEIGMPDLNLDFKSYDRLTAKKVFNEYVEMARQVVHLLRNDSQLSSNQNVITVVDREITQMAQLEVELNKHTKSLEDRRNITLKVNPMNISALQQTYPYVPWLEYVANLLPPGSNITEADSVVVLDTEYLTELGRVLDATPKRVVANYLVWRALYDHVLPHLTAAARLIVTEYLTGSSEVAPQRWDECVKIVQKSMRPVTSAMYVRRFSSEEARRSAKEMVGDITKEMYRLLESVDWMDSGTRKAAMLKAEIMRFNVAYPDELLNDTVLEDFYEGVDFHADRLLENILALERDWRLKNGKRLHKNVKKLDWTNISGVTDVVNAFYAHGENSLSIPAGILQGAFFQSDRPQYMNYGGIGFVIGHEVSHGFDELGRQFNMDGLMDNWWDKETALRFNEKVRCIVQQYSHLVDREVNETVNGVITQSENIADNAGLKLAYRAYRRYTARHGTEPNLPVRPGMSLKPQQLFWVSFASIWCSKDLPQELVRKLRTSDHPPGMHRVNGAVRNLEAFASDFNCPVGSPMNPIHKCEVW